MSEGARDLFNFEYIVAKFPRRLYGVTHIFEVFLSLLLAPLRGIIGMGETSVFSFQQ
jgi:hypothetical protein